VKVEFYRVQTSVKVIYISYLDHWSFIHRLIKSSPFSNLQSPLTKVGGLSNKTKHKKHNSKQSGE